MAPILAETEILAKMGAIIFAHLRRNFSYLLQNTAIEATPE